MYAKVYSTGRRNHISMTSPHANQAHVAFEYLTSGEALNTEHPVYVSQIPEELLWGMNPLGWRYLGHTKLVLGEHDLWAPPHQPEQSVAAFLADDPAPTYQLAVPRVHGPGQYEIRFEHIFPKRTRELNLFLATPSVTLWRATITTRSELNTQLLTLHTLASDPETLAALHALQSLRA
jgi:hypothetical protein